MRLDQKTYFFEIAKLVAQRSSCLHRQIGCILVDNHNHIIATGYNGPPQGLTHCKSCRRENVESGQRLEKCYAVHAEINALLQCWDVTKIHKCYVTVSPCLPCTSALLNTSCEEIIFGEVYPNPDAEILWKGANRKWIQF